MREGILKRRGGEEKMKIAIAMLALVAAGLMLVPVRVAPVGNEVAWAQRRTPPCPPYCAERFDKKVVDARVAGVRVD